MCRRMVEYIPTDSSSNLEYVSYSLLICRLTTSSLDPRILWTTSHRNIPTPSSVDTRTVYLSARIQFLGTVLQPHSMLSRTRHQRPVCTEAKSVGIPCSGSPFWIPLHLSSSPLQSSLPFSFLYQLFLSSRASPRTVKKAFQDASSLKYSSVSCNLQ